MNLRKLTTSLKKTTILTGGKREPLALLPWQKDFLKAFCDPKIRKIALTLGRGNGKTAFIANLCHVLFQEFLNEGEDIIAISATYKQASILLGDVIAQSDDYKDRKLYKTADSHASCRIDCKSTGKVIQAISSKPTSAHGFRPSIIVWDEPAQASQNERQNLYDVLITGLGKNPHQKMILIGTTAADSTHFFEKWLNGAADVAFNFRAKNHDLTWENVKLANPSIMHKNFKSLRETVKSELKDAKSDPTLADGFRQLRMNLPIQASHEKAVISSENWLKLETAEPLNLDGRFTLGIDLGSTRSMTAVTAFFTESRALASMGFFGDDPDLARRGRMDGVGDLYVEAERRGELTTTQGKITDIEAVMRWILDNWGKPLKIVVDRWRLEELRETLRKMNFPRCQIVTRGQGFKDGNEDVETFRKSVIGENFKVPINLLVRSSFSQAVTQSDPAGNCKISKKNSRARDDLVCSIVLAVAHGMENKKRRVLRFGYA